MTAIKMSESGYGMDVTAQGLEIFNMIFLANISHLKTKRS